MSNSFAGFFSGRHLGAAYSISALAIIHVLVEQHVHVQYDQLSSYSSIFEHKCGVAMVLTLLWAFAVTVFALLETGSPEKVRSSHRVIRAGGRTMVTCRVLR